MSGTNGSSGLGSVNSDDMDNKTVNKKKFKLNFYLPLLMVKAGDH
jgi:hypothetical protein